MPIIPIEKLKPGTGGGKASGLARLTRLGLRVPPALVIPEANPENLPEDIEKRWTAIQGGPAAVRSSGSDEDADEASAAGQYETFLNVAPEALTEAVRRCAESAKSERVSAYGKELSGSTGSGMSVVIQAMVRPSRAGVVFTANPITGDRNVMVVEAVASLGEELVSGRAEAARYMLNNPPDSADGTSGLIRESSGDLETAALNEETLEAIRSGAALAAAEWGVPLDLEWAIEEKTGRLHWLQARPITALADSLNSEIGPEDLVTRCNIGEMMPGAVTPLTYDTFARSLNKGMSLYYRSFGALRRKEPDPDFFANFEDQIFINLSPMYLMCRRVMGATAEGTELSLLGYVLPPHDVGPHSHPFTKFINGVRYFAGLFGWRNKVRALKRLARNCRLETDGLDAAGILRMIKNEHPRKMDRAVALHYAASAFSGAMNAALAMTLSNGTTQITEKAKRLMTDLLAGVKGVESAAVLEGLEELALLIRSEGAEDLLGESDTPAADIHVALLADKTAVGAAYRAFINRHGHRCIREAELREPEWALKPDHLIDSLKSLTTAPPQKIEENTARESNARPAETVESTSVAKSHTATSRPHLSEKSPADDEAPALPEGVNPKAVAWIAKQARVGVRVREQSKSLLILVIHRFKVAVRALAARLEEEGFLPEADLTYFLTMEELTNLVEDRQPGLIGRARRRRRLYPEHMELRFPDLSCGRPLPEPPPVPDGGSTLTGTPVSRGIVEGTVRVVKTREDAESLRKGDIMVAQFTDIGWTPFYGRVAGMITEIGGALSHGSVVAREYGLPLVGSLSGACTFFQNGDRVRIDGGTGNVVLLKKKDTASV